MRHPFNFSDLPAALQRPLLLGFTGRPHLHTIASIALAHSKGADDLYATIAADALLAAWGENPFDGNCVSALAGTLDRLPELSSQLMPVIKEMLAHWKPGATPEAQEAMLKGPEAQRAFLQEALAREPENYFWLHTLYEYGRINGDWRVIAESMSTAQQPESLAPLFSFALANCAFGIGDYVGAASFYELCDLPLPLAKEREAAAWLRHGGAERTEELLRECCEARPWNVGLWHRLHEVTRAEVEKELPAGKIMVLGYSWNKADDLAETLDSLANSSLSDDVHVRILDNGSSDGTPDVIRKFVARYGADKAECVTMPVNVGAPAARNWLMHLPEVVASDYVAFLDDDISLPADWLLKLGQAVARYPDAGVWGCKVVNYDGPMRVQCGEHNLTANAHERQEVLMSTTMLQDGDFGQAEYIRPCASVTGCVHLFKTETLLANGDFDLRFSPTQYDDLERDLRMVLGGGYAVYTGHLAIPHKRKSGAMADIGKPESANGAGNLHKLVAKYSAKEFEQMAQSMDAVLLADLMKKMELIRQ